MKRKEKRKIKKLTKEAENAMYFGRSRTIVDYLGEREEVSKGEKALSRSTLNSAGLEMRYEIRPSEIWRDSTFGISIISYEGQEVLRATGTPGNSSGNIKRYIQGEWREEFEELYQEARALQDRDLEASLNTAVEREQAELMNFGLMERVDRESLPIKDQ